MKNDLEDIIKNIKISAEDIYVLADFGILPLIEDIENNSDKLNKLLEEITTVRDNLSKNIAALKRKI